MKVVQDKFKNTSAGLDIGFLTGEIPSQSDIKSYVTKGHIDFPLTLPKDGKNQTFPIGVLKFRKLMQNSIPENGLSGVSITLEYYRGSARPGSNEVIHVKLRKRKSACFELFSSFMFLCD